ncbi:hypothetical protein [Frankia sp. Cppng1_Ct_nod]|uniref:hypothetical protein n=1 Tax=Frankia sp. Cppng1_Ct_nod TaxID=2897162 RepID=UPI001041949E|nr:hypothetical protein [Frankia sp. Cppng1_Ct_nod]
MSVIRVEPRDARAFDVEIAEETAGDVEGRAFHFQVTVGDAILADLALADPDQATTSALVRESFAFLLAREPAGAILRTFDLSVIPTYFPEYVSELRPRFG